MSKKKILAIIRQSPKSVFGVYDPEGISILTQLRVSLSTLNYHQFKHNFRNTLNPLCPINDGIEIWNTISCFAKHIVQLDDIFSRVLTIYCTNMVSEI